MDSQNNLVEVLGVLWRWRKKIIGITLVVAIGSVVLSLLLNNYYQATTIFFAASPDTNKPEQVFGQTNKATRFYGDDFDNDRLLTVASSGELIQFLLDSFQVADHYKMKTDSPKRKFKLEKKFRSNFDVTKTKFDAISLSFEDKDPAFAATVANEARNQVANLTLSFLHIGHQKRIETYQGSILAKTKEIKIIGDSLQILRKKYSIFDLKSQGELLSTIAAEAESNLAGTSAKLKKLKSNGGFPDSVVVLQAEIMGYKKQLETVLGEKNGGSFSLKLLREGMGAIQALDDRYESLSDQLDIEKEKLRQTKTVLNSNAPTIILAEKADIPKIKSKPKRSILVLAATLGAFIFSLLGALLFENIGKLDFKRIKGE